jgi:hypothetical protein
MTRNYNAMSLLSNIFIELFSEREREREREYKFLYYIGL